MAARRILVTGAGGVGGVNFINAARIAEDYFIVGVDHDDYYLQLPRVEARFKSPRHDDPSFIPLIRKLVDEYGVEFIHPQPEVEVEVIASSKAELEGVKTLLPGLDAIKIARDKLRTAEVLKRAGVNVPDTAPFSPEDVEDLLQRHGRLWVRSRKGAGGKLSLPVNSVEEAELWVKLWVKRGAVSEEDFIVQEYLPGRDVAWDSLWFEGKLVASYARERLRYIFPHVSPSRVTGTPTVAKIIRDAVVNEVAERAVKAIDPKPQGFYCVDLKFDKRGRPAVTEVNIKAHTTLGLWSYVAQRALSLSRSFNLVYLYLQLGLEGEVEGPPRPYDIYPEVTLMRHIDAGVLVEVNGEWRRVEY